MNRTKTRILLAIIVVVVIAAVIAVGYLIVGQKHQQEGKLVITLHSTSAHWRPTTYVLLVNGQVRLDGIELNPDTYANFTLKLTWPEPAKVLRAYVDVTWLNYELMPNDQVVVSYAHSDQSIDVPAGGMVRIQFDV